MEIKKGRSLWIFCLIWSCCKGKEPVQIGKEKNLILRLFAHILLSIGDKIVK